MVNVYLATDLDTPVRQFPSVFQFAKEEQAARVGTSMATNFKAVSTAAYNNVNSKKIYRKMYSALFSDFIQLRRD